MGNFLRIFVIAIALMEIFHPNAVRAENTPWAVSDYDTRLVWNCIANEIIRSNVADLNNRFDILQVVKDKETPTDDWQRNLFKTFDEIISDIQRNETVSRCKTDPTLNIDHSIDLFAQIGEFPETRRKIVIRTCSLGRAYQRERQIIIQYNCANVRHSPPNGSSEGWCRRQFQGNEFFLASFKRRAGEITFVGSEKFDEADGPNPSIQTCWEESDPTNR